MKIKKTKNFRGQFYFLSNFYECKIIIGGKKFKSSEHAYQTLKLSSKKDREIVRKSDTPATAKRMARRFQTFENFEEKKITIMRLVVFEKFQQNKILIENLVATKNIKLIEGNTWHDNFWGNCYCKNCKKIKGENNLGKLLMEIRDILSNSFVYVRN